MKKMTLLIMIFCFCSVIHAQITTYNAAIYGNAHSLSVVVSNSTPPTVNNYESIGGGAGTIKIGKTQDVSGTWWPQNGFLEFDCTPPSGYVPQGSIITVTTAIFHAQLTNYSINQTWSAGVLSSDILSMTKAQKSNTVQNCGDISTNYNQELIYDVKNQLSADNKIIIGIKADTYYGAFASVSSAYIEFSCTITPPVTITTSSNPAAGGSTAGGGTFMPGTSVTVTATAYSGYTFADWRENGTVVSTNSSYSFTANSNRNLTANFVVAQYTVTTSSNPPNGGTTSGGGTYAAGTNVTLSATPAVGSSFINWTENGNVVSSNASFTIQVNSNRDIVANFTAPPVNLTVGYNRGTGKIVAYTGSNYATPYAPATLSDVQGAQATFAPIPPGNDGAPTENGYNLIFNENQATTNVSYWEFNYSNGIINPNYNLSSAHNTVTLAANINNGYYKARMYRLCDVTITATSHEGEIPIQIQVDGTNRTTSYGTTKIEGNTISLTAPSNYTLTSGYWMNYAFAYWKVDGNFYSSNPVLTEIQINGHKSFEAYYTSTINNGYKTTQYSGNTGDYITLDWSEHPNSNVSYQIWRRVRHAGITGPEECIATLNHGTTIFTDYDYIYTASYSDDMLWYDIRGYYPINQTYAEAEFVSVYGKMEASINDKHESVAIIEETIPSQYSLRAYPNPFNPSSVIRYQLPEVGFVSLKVYNLLSQEVASLVEEVKGAGIHTVNFNANNLPSGIYIARLQAGSKVMSQKLQLIK